MMYNIYHYGPFKRNWGDLALIYGMQTGILEAAQHRGVGVKFTPIDLKEPAPLDSNFIELINTTGSMLLVGGGGLVMKGDGFNTRSGWQFNVSLSDLNKIKVPLVVYSIGYNHFPNDKVELSSDTWKHLKATQSKAEMFSVRNWGTSRVLVQHGLNEMPVISDPAITLQNRGVSPFDFDDDSFYIGVNWAGDRAQLRHKEDTKKLIGILCLKLEELLNTIPKAKLLFIPHMAYDFGPFLYFQGILGKKNISNLADLCPHLYPESMARVPLFAEVYKRMNLVIGMRGHSLIIPYGQGTPVIAFGNHNKVKFFADDVYCEHLGHQCSGFNSMVRTTLSKNAREKHASHLTHLKHISSEWNNKVIDLLGPG